MTKATRNGGDGGDPHAAVKTPICGIVMPISAIDDCSATHWAEVREIVEDAAENAGFDARLVSAADYSGIILKQIVHNLYHNPIVVCDVSARNPNVMFELGLRLAFDKPTILMKDDRTNYAFDTSPIEHLEYPRDLRFARILEFKAALAEKIRATHQKATIDKDYTTFLKHFGEFKVAMVETKEVSGQEFIIGEIREIKSYLRALATRESVTQRARQARPREVRLAIRGDRDKIEEALSRLHSLPGFSPSEIIISDDEHMMIHSTLNDFRAIVADLHAITDDLGLKYDASIEDPPLGRIHK